MAFVYRLKYADGRKEVDEEFTYFARYDNGSAYYVLAENNFLELDDIIAWCPSCQKLTSVEDVQPIAKLEEKIAVMDHPGSEGYLKIFRKIEPEARVAWWKHKRIKVLEWRKRRASPAKCLACGNHNILDLISKDWISHPQTGEPCRLEHAGISSGRYRKCSYFDIEGNSLTLSDDEYEDMQIRRKAWQERENRENPSP